MSGRYNRCIRTRRLIFVYDVTGVTETISGAIAKVIHSFLVFLVFSTKGAEHTERRANLHGTMARGTTKWWEPWLVAFFPPEMWGVLAAVMMMAIFNILVEINKVLWMAFGADMEPPLSTVPPLYYGRYYGEIAGWYRARRERADDVRMCFPPLTSPGYLVVGLHNVVFLWVLRCMIYVLMGAVAVKIVKYSLFLFRRALNLLKHGLIFLIDKGTRALIFICLATIVLLGRVRLYLGLHQQLQ